MAGVPPVTVPSVALGSQRRGNSESTSSARDISSATSAQPGLWAHAADNFSVKETSNTRAVDGQPGFSKLTPSVAETGRIESGRWNRRSAGIRGPALELDKAVEAPAATGPTFSSQLSHFVSVHPVFHPTHTSPHFGNTQASSQKGSDTPYSTHGELTAEAFTKAFRPGAPAAHKAPPETATSKERHSGTVQAETLRSRPTTDLGVAEAASPGPPVRAYHKQVGSGADSESSTGEPSIINLRDNAVWRRWFLRLGTAHAIAPEFAEALVVPNLQFGDRLLEAFFSLEFYRKRIRWRVVGMCAFGLLLVLFQLWMGFGNAGRLRRISSANDYASTKAPSTYLDGHRWLQEEARSRQLTEIVCSAVKRRLWSSVSEGVENANELSFYTLACVDQAVVDGIVLLTWILLGFSARMEVRMEAINIIVQLFRTTLLIFFAQGMYSPCAIKQGAVDIVMNNLAVASANTTVFNCLGLARYPY
eukprot:Gregarina_sp_Poly_1__2876@NODE_1801_length_3303_cov_54_601360_g165_i2_p1_GENE_NODE_1801_length_3303_cov_54_601360_g165_i2NODE_1801_length_3303_cov_54_601360_g165_i2_p1_ORF_typecomplete_len476_score52_87_NODE_1801_length_3303_cov_54_601360_g165_i215793006